MISYMKLGLQIETNNVNLLRLSEIAVMSKCFEALVGKHG